jgi:acyl-CoA reductase-like NAD-dependent aldehyde dehydrogenase
MSYFDLAIDEGAEVVAGGGVPDLGADLASGAWIEPTLWTGLDNKHRILREEIFGPVAALCRFDTEAEAIARANETEYGLSAYLFTRDIGRGLRVARQIESGMIALNRGLVSDPAAPFGGVKQSGLGREGGTDGIYEFLETKYIAASI